MLNYFKDVRAEMRHVAWPSRATIIVYTVVVIVASLATALYLGAWDYLFAEIVKTVI